MEANLVATRIVNKNGISTVVYRAVDKSVSKPASSIPAPPAPDVLTEPLPTGDKATDDMNFYLHNRLKVLSSSVAVQKRMAATLHPDTARVVGHTIGSHNIQVITPAVDWCMHSRDFSLLNNLAVITMPDGATGSHAQTHLRAVHGLSRTESQVKLTKMDEAEVESYRALVDAAKNIAGQHVVTVSGGKGITGTRLYLKDPELEQFILRNHERVDEIVKVVNSGRAFEAELFQRILDSPTRALSEGEL